MEGPTNSAVPRALGFERRQGLFLGLADNGSPAPVDAERRVRGGGGGGGGGVGGGGGAWGGGWGGWKGEEALGFPSQPLPDV
jgi:hypothetical protein